MLSEKRKSAAVEMGNGIETELDDLQNGGGQVRRGFPDQA